MPRYKVHVEAAKLGFTKLLNLRADPVRLSMWAFISVYHIQIIVQILPASSLIDMKSLIVCRSIKCRQMGQLL